MRFGDRARTHALIATCLERDVVDAPAEPGELDHEIEVFGRECAAVSARPGAVLRRRAALEDPEFKLECARREQPAAVRAARLLLFMVAVAGVRVRARTRSVYAAGQREGRGER